MDDPLHNDLIRMALTYTQKEIHKVLSRTALPPLGMSFSTHSALKKLDSQFIFSA